MAQIELYPQTRSPIPVQYTEKPYFKVRIDGVGERIAINMSPDVLRVGDKVQCSIHNNPVEA